MPIKIYIRVFKIKAVQFVKEPDGQVERLPFLSGKHGKVQEGTLLNCKQHYAFLNMNFPKGSYHVHALCNIIVLAETVSIAPLRDHFGFPVVDNA